MSGENSSRSQRRQRRDMELTDTVAEAMRQLGWIAPNGEEDVRRAETELTDAPVQLPDVLGDPDAVFARSARDDDGNVYQFPADPDTEGTLARAARDGGAIPPEIERMMRQDRLAAEQENDDGPQEPTETS